ncbi:MAG: capsule assembly Wzi family protein, partial [Prolixibacteraceae bacterium]|nr:capsule assembly Wzi family protein [Prolixibacteraceae bacterium]
NAHIHHKSLYLRYMPASSWSVKFRVDHYVMWGGTSPDERIGRMPADLKSYLIYITGSKGDEDFPLTDQANISGNQLGAYNAEIRKCFETGEAAFYLSHPFDDFSGVNWRNWPDNLLGVHIRLYNSKVTDIVYEYTNTRQQSINGSYYFYNEESGKTERKEDDNYFNHSIYRSGFTYNKFIMGSPLFFPLKIDDDMVTGISSTRFYAHHVGVSGYFTDFIRWRGLITFTAHKGRYAVPYDPVHKQISGLLEVNYSNPRFPVEIGLAAAADAGNAIKNNPGFRLSLSKNFR